MFSKSMSIGSILCFVATVALVANAAVVENERRQLDSILNTLTSGADSVLSDATSGIDSLTSGASSVASSVVSDATSVASSAVSGVSTVLQTVGSEVKTVITSAGQAITLAESGTITNFAGSTYTVATGAASSTGSNAAVSLHPTSTTPLLSSIVAIFASMFFGAWVAL